MRPGPEDDISQSRLIPKLGLTLKEGEGYCAPLTILFCVELIKLLAQHQQAIIEQKPIDIDDAVRNLPLLILLKNTVQRQQTLTSTRPIAEKTLKKQLTFLVNPATKEPHLRQWSYVELINLMLNQQSPGYQVSASAKLAGIFDRTQLEATFTSMVPDNGIALIGTPTHIFLCMHLNGKYFLYDSNAAGGISAYLESQLHLLMYNLCQKLVAREESSISHRYYAARFITLSIQAPELHEQKQTEEKQTPPGLTPLESSYVDYIATQGIQNKTAVENCNILHMLVKNEQIDLIRHLLAATKIVGHGERKEFISTATLNTGFGSTQLTPLATACLFGYTDIVHALLQRHDHDISHFDSARNAAGNNPSTKDTIIDMLNTYEQQQRTETLPPFEFNIPIDAEESDQDSVTYYSQSPNDSDADDDNPPPDPSPPSTRP